MVILTKPIQPGKFDQEAFFIALAFTAEETGKDIKKDFLKTVETWTKKPEFEVVTSVGPKSVDVLVETDNELYRNITKGTPPDFIVPKKPGGVLVFQKDYTAKTTPRVIGSQQGGASGELIFAKWVEHPGIKAREFDETIQKKWEKPYKRRMEKALSEGAKNSGHSI